MSKYLITEAQRDAILSIPGYQNLKDEIAALKPIEPLSDDWIQSKLDQIPEWYDVCEDDIAGLCRAIERHITGETP